MANKFERLPYKDASHQILYGLAHFMVGQYLVIEYDTAVAGSRFLKDNGPRVDAITHTRAIEPAVAAIAEEERALPTMAKIELFEDPRYKKLGVQLGDIIELVDAFPVRRESPGHSSLRIPQRHLREGKAVGMFAQGTRNYNFNSLYKGAALLSYLENVPLQPIVIASQPICHSGFQRQEIIRVIASRPLRHNPDLRKREAIDRLTDDLSLVFERDFRRARHWANFDAQHNKMCRLKMPGRIRRYA